MRIFMLYAACAVPCLCLYGCGAGGETEPAVVVSTDTETAEELFPSLEGIVSSEIEQVRYGGSKRGMSLPSPTDCIYRGYITLSDTAAKKYASEYSFTKRDVRVSFEAIEERKKDWEHSAAMDSELVPPRYAGFTAVSGNTVLFEIGTVAFSCLQT